MVVLYKKKKKKPVEELEEKAEELSKKEVKKLKKVEEKNVELKEKIEYLAQQNAENDAILEKVEDIKEILEENEQLKAEKQQLIQRYQQLPQQQVIIESSSSESSETLGPITLVISGGAFLYEKTVLAMPTMPMGRILELYCAERKERRDNCAFYNKDTGTKMLVDNAKTAHENGFTNGSRILMEKLGQ